MHPGNTIVAGSGKPQVICRGCYTRDIMSAILQADKVAAPYTIDFAKSFEGLPTDTVCEELWQWVRQNIQYVEDPDGQQLIKSPGETWRTGFADCKSMSLFCASVLQNLGIPYHYRFISETEGDYHHVYLIVDGTIPLDCVYEEYGAEVPYQKKKDMAGLHTTTAAPGHIGSILDYLQQHSYGGYGSKSYGEVYFNFDLKDVQGVSGNHIQTAHMQAYKQHITKIYELHYAACIQGIKNKFSTQALKRNKAVKGFNLLAKVLHTTMYAFAEDAGYSFAEMFGPNWANKPCAIGGTFGAKRNAALDVVNQLRDEMGVPPQSLRWVVDFMVFGQYGISLQLMLEKMRCIAQYGVDWAPLPGIPYYSIANSAWQVNGGNWADTFAVAACFPYVANVPDGTAPFVPAWGNPYWCRYGYVVPNGATAAELDFWVNANPMPASLQALVAQEQHSPEEFTAAYQIFETWRGGNYPMYPPNTKDKEAKMNAHIGSGEIGTAAIIAIVIAVIQLVLGIVAGILATLEKVKALKNNQRGNLPTSDLHFPYVTADGCNVSWPGPVAVKCCPNAAGGEDCTLLTEADLQNPVNQPAGGDGSDSFFNSPMLPLLLAAAGAFLLLSSKNE